MIKYRTSCECSSVFCGLMIVACVRVRMLQMSVFDAKGTLRIA